MVYHGTDADFTVFDRAKTRATMDIQGNFFSPWEDDARGYGSNVRRFFLNLRNPADENTGYHSLHEFEGQNGAGVKARERLVALGYDGVNNGGEEFIAFSPEQIKSATENVGTFDAGNPDIRYSLGGGKVLRAWHGSPHMFAAEEGAPLGRFRLDKVDTGEGSQAFGHGIYLTAKEKIGRFYAERLGDSSALAIMKEYGLEWLGRKDFARFYLARTFENFKNNLNSALKIYTESDKRSEAEKEAMRESVRRATENREVFEDMIVKYMTIDKYFAKARAAYMTNETLGDPRPTNLVYEELKMELARNEELAKMTPRESGPRRHLYSAELTIAEDESDVLDWTQKLTKEQRARIRAGLLERGFTRPEITKMLRGKTFSETYYYLQGEKWHPSEVSQFLSEIGFVGHKYPAASMGTGDYSHGTNYVIYDENAIEIKDAVRWQVKAQEQAAWDKVLDKYERGEMGQRETATVLERTPVVLQRCGAADLPIRISKGVLDKVSKDKHEVSVSELRKLLTNLDNPIAVFQSRTQPDSMVVLTELVDDANRQNAVVALRLDAKESGGGHKVNAVASIYGKKAYSVAEMLRGGEALYVHTQKVRAYLRSGRLQLPAEASKRGRSSLLTQDDFTQDELGVVKVNNKKPLDGRGEVYGAYDPRTREVFVAENARVDTLLHELGWHAAYDWARTHEPKLYAQMRSYAQSAPEEVRAAVREAYAGFSEEAMLDEIGAAAFSEEFTGLVEERLAEIKDGRRRGIVKRWWAGFKKLAVRLWRALTGREETPQEAMKRLAETFAEGKQLGSWSLENVEVNRSAVREQREMDEDERKKREKQKKAREQALSMIDRSSSNCLIFCVNSLLIPAPLSAFAAWSVSASRSSASLGQSTSRQILQVSGCPWPAALDTACPAGCRGGQICSP